MRGLSDFTPPAAAVEYWPSFVDAVQLVNGKSAGWPAELDLVCRWYAPHLERIHEDAAVRQRDLVQLAQIASGYSSRERFLTELTLDPPDSTSDQAGVPRLDAIASASCTTTMVRPTTGDRDQSLGRRRTLP